MFNATCSIIILALSLCIPFVAVVAWLAYNLDGYPAFMIFHAFRDRDSANPPRPRFVSNGSTMFGALANQRPTHALPALWTASTAVPRAQDATKRNKTAAI
jgi:hypothetical protein